MGTEDHLVICLGFRRAGSTLQYNLARTLVEYLKAGCGLGFHLESDALRACAQGLQGKGLVGVLKTYNRDLTCLCDLPLKVSILYIYRDLRDVFSSLKKKKQITDVEEFLVLARSHLDAVERLRSTHEVLYQKYEDVYSNLEGGTREIAAFVGLQTTQEDIARIKALNTVDAAITYIRDHFSLKQRFVNSVNRLMRSQPRKTKDLARSLGLMRHVRSIIPGGNIVSSGFMLHPDHISRSRGQPSAWKRELPEHEAKLVTECFRDWLDAHGYT